MQNIWQFAREMKYFIGSTQIWALNLVSSVTKTLHRRAISRKNLLRARIVDLGSYHSETKMIKQTVTTYFEI